MAKTFPFTPARMDWRFRSCPWEEGVISVLANIVPADVHRMIKHVWRGLGHSPRLQLKALPLIKALFCETSPIPVKAAMNMLGMKVGECRLPLVEMEEPNRAKLRPAMLDYRLKLQ